ncbi:hypothetical protein HanXRQr2_Chr17g0806491 [Helianthus annuus]|uniref:Uncharacterized protein n=1 Tax=Helianthus annuus TaxID=4232 RepID=A0A251RPP5_HELAN|nr:hypothetical protein HanXRQr2_Chr17g0806491 [Helianthus annuus]KAJ0429307.1 hypothetical protein HanHA300_Chr17g0655821 [Helianthus annuus]KAJ0636491.1 hypothetical protein HanOQP8_Chr17g0662501 [Helianthus annuus]
MIERNTTTTPVRWWCGRDRTEKREREEEERERRREEREGVGGPAVGDIDRRSVLVSGGRFVYPTVFPLLMMLKDVEERENGEGYDGGGGGAC